MTNLSPRQEQEFRAWIRSTQWFRDYVARYKEEPNLDDPAYDYRAAWLGGIVPEYEPEHGEYRWSDQLPSGQWLKSESHPTRWVGEFYDRFGYDPEVAGISQQRAAEMMAQPPSSGGSRLAQAVNKILRSDRTMGMGRVASVVRPGEIRLENRSERVVVAGNVTPAVGAEIPWVIVNPGLLVASYSLPAGMPAPQHVGREWEQVLIGPGRAELALRDSSGRYWAALRGMSGTRALSVYDQEAAAFLSPWAVVGGGWDGVIGYGVGDRHWWDWPWFPLECGIEGSVLGAAADGWLELGQVYRYLPSPDPPFSTWWAVLWPNLWLQPIVVRAISIDPETGDLGYGEVVELPDQDLYPAPGYAPASSCQDGLGYYWVSAQSPAFRDGGGYPPLPYPDRTALAWLWHSDSPNDTSAWTRVAMDQAYEGQLLVRAIGNTAVLFELNIEAGPCRHRYRVGASGAWYALDLGDETVLDICPGVLMLLIASRQTDGSLVYRGAALSGGLLVLGDPLALAAGGQVVLHVPGLEGHWGAWMAAIQSEGEDQTLWRLSHDGLPIGSTDEAVEAPDMLALSPSWSVNMAAGGYSAKGDGFLLFGDWTNVWASRITE